MCRLERERDGFVGVVVMICCSSFTLLYIFQLFVYLGLVITVTGAFFSYLCIQVITVTCAFYLTICLLWCMGMPDLLHMMGVPFSQEACQFSWEILHGGAKAKFQGVPNSLWHFLST